jgi:hypothetical protein
MPNSWKIAGSYFEVCNCDVACPCLFLSPPTSGDCTLLLAWHIDHGRFGQIDLDGLNAVLAVHSPGHMLEVKWKVALYIDERANQDQQDALTQIFSGQAGWPLAGFAPFIGEVLGVKTATIEYRAEGKRRSIRLFAVQLPVCVNRRARKADPGKSAQARPLSSPSVWRASRFWRGCI